MKFNRIQLPTPHRLSGLALVISGLTAFTGGPAFAQTATLPSTKAVPPARTAHHAIPATGVIVPRATVDPGMKVHAPAIPAQSTPVIRPEQTPPNDGSVVVPR